MQDLLPTTVGAGAASAENLTRVCMSQFRYLTFDARELKTLLNHPREVDAYLAEDRLSQALVRALAAGYRWVRTDGDAAVFERQVHLQPTQLHEVSLEALRKEILFPLG